MDKNNPIGKGNIINGKDICGCDGFIKIMYFRDTDGKLKPDYAVCTKCLKHFTVSD